jgi:hypothetical protein
MNGRIWAWPAVSGQLTPPRKAFWLTWPAWLSFCQNELGEEPHPLISPVLLSDPPNFLASLNNLLALIREGGPVTTEIPFADQESAESIKGCLSGQNPGQKKTRPPHLVVVLDHLARSEARLAEFLFHRAQRQKQALFAELKGYQEFPARPGPINLPGPNKAVALAWWNLAQPLVKPNDHLWPVFPDLSPQDVWPKLNLQPDNEGFYSVSTLIETLGGEKFDH